MIIDVMVKGTRDSEGEENRQRKITLASVIMMIVLLLMLKLFMLPS